MRGTPQQPGGRLSRSFLDAQARDERGVEAVGDALVPANVKERAQLAALARVGATCQCVCALWTGVALAAAIEARLSLSVTPHSRASHARDGARPHTPPKTGVHCRPSRSHRRRSARSILASAPWRAHDNPHVRRRSAAAQHVAPRLKCDERRRLAVEEGAALDDARQLCVSRRWVLVLVGPSVGRAGCDCVAALETTRPFGEAASINARVGLARAQGAPLRANHAVSGKPGECRSTRPRVLQAAARLEPRGRREANGQVHARARRSPRRPMTAHLSHVGRSSPLLADDI